MSTSPRSAADYTVACICPMGVELAPVEGMLDEIHEAIPLARDRNAYTLGQISGHNIVVAVLPAIGNNPAATVATQLLNDFPSIRFGLLVGIGGGVPGAVDVRLGDVVVGQATGTFGGVVQYDLGKRIDGGKFQRTGFLNRPPAILSAHVRKLESQHTRRGNQLQHLLSEMIKQYPLMREKYSHPSTAHDDLFLTSYQHVSGSSCSGCDREMTVTRVLRSSSTPLIHYGTIGSADSVVKNATLRDELQRDMGLICVEMEAAGIMNDFPCLVIRGICDYADSHKNKDWQPYAAAMAAAYMKELLSNMPVMHSQQSGLALQDESSCLYLPGAPVIDHDSFVGRAEEIGRMAEILQPYKQSDEQRRLVVGGMGGIGKTQLAIAYARCYVRAYSSIIWLNATSDPTMRKSLWSLAERIGQTQQYDALHDDQMIYHVRRWLTDKNNIQWLLIVDNYDDHRSVDLDQYLPYVSHGSMIITTRLPEEVPGHVIRPSLLDNIEDGLQILSTRSGRCNIESDEGAVGLVKRLGGLPLALAAAGAYLRHSPWTFEQYQQAYNTQWHMEPSQTTYLKEYQDRTLYTTWDLTFARLETENQIAAKLLRLLAYFDHQHISYDLFRPVHVAKSSSRRLRVKNHLSKLLNVSLVVPPLQWLTDLATDVTKIDRIMLTLAKYGFIEGQSDLQSYIMHACVHDWTLFRLNTRVDSESYWYAFDCVAYSVSTIKVEDYGHHQYGNIAAQAAHLLHNKFDVIGCDISESRLQQALHIAILLSAQLRISNAEKMFLRTLAKNEQIYGVEGISTLIVARHFGHHYFDQANVNDAERMYNRALSGREKVFGRGHPLTINMMECLGALYCSSGRSIQAEKMLKEALAWYETTSDWKNVNMALTIYNLGCVYAQQGRLIEAERMFVCALEIEGKVPGYEHVFTRMATASLGNLYRKQGRIAEAERMYSKALQVDVNESEPRLEYGSLLKIIRSLDAFYKDQGKLFDADQIYLQVLVKREDIFGTKYCSALHVAQDISNLYHDQGKTEQARVIDTHLQSIYYNIVIGMRSMSVRVIMRYAELLAKCIAAYGWDTPQSLKT